MINPHYSIIQSLRYQQDFHVIEFRKPRDTRGQGKPAAAEPVEFGGYMERLNPLYWLDVMIYKRAAHVPCCSEAQASQMARW